MRKRKPSNPRDHVAVRLKPEEIARLEMLRARLSTSWHEATRSDALRAVILKGLDVMEKEDVTPAQGGQEPEEQEEAADDKPVPSPRKTG